MDAHNASSGDTALADFFRAVLGAAVAEEAAVERLVVAVRLRAAVDLAGITRLHQRISLQVHYNPKNAFAPSVFRKIVAESGWRGMGIYAQAGARCPARLQASLALTRLWRYRNAVLLASAAKL